MAARALGPATLAVVQAVDALEPGAWLVACSGGADSLALAWAARHVAGRRGTPVRALVVDHGLQPDSDAVASRVLATCASFGLDAAVARVDVPEAGAGPEASAREARYEALHGAVAAAGGQERVLLGHTLDDQAETVLLGLARGSGVRSLAGMRAERGVLLRPLLGVRRSTTEATCVELGLTPWRDPMNAAPRFARVRARERVLPVLERELGPGIAQALARSAASAARAHDVIAALAQQTTAELADDCAHLAGLAPGVRRAVLADRLAFHGVTDLATTHVDAVERLVTHWRGQRGVDVPGGRVTRRDGRLQYASR